MTSTLCLFLFLLSIAFVYSLANLFSACFLFSFNAFPPSRLDLPPTRRWSQAVFIHLFLALFHPWARKAPHPKEQMRYKGIILSFLLRRLLIGPKTPDIPSEGFYTPLSNPPFFNVGRVDHVLPPRPKSSWSPVYPHVHAHDKHLPLVSINGGDPDAS